MRGILALCEEWTFPAVKMMYFEKHAFILDEYRSEVERSSYLKYCVPIESFAVTRLHDSGCDFRLGEVVEHGDIGRSVDEVDMTPQFILFRDTEAGGGMAGMVCSNPVNSCSLLR